MMTYNLFLKLLDAKFEEKLQAKTGWGRNEIFIIYQEAKTEALAEMLDKQAEGK